MIGILRKRSFFLQLVAVGGTTGFLLIVLALKIPSAYSNFWAEDGVFYQQALDNRFPGDFFISGGSYVIFISRILSNLVAIGPIEYAPLVNTVLVMFFLAFFIERVYVNLGHLIRSRIYKFIICLSVLLLPINNYETIASGTALHFQLLFVALVINLAAIKNGAFTAVDLIVLLITILSDPFGVIVLVPLFLGRVSNIVRFWKGKKLILFSVVGSVALQLAMMAIFHFRGDRALGASHSILKVTYLFLDRVIGSAFIPHWGYISSDSFTAGNITVHLIIRAGIAFLCFAALAGFLFFFLRSKFALGEIHSKTTVIWLVLLPSIYWLIAGYLANPESRYAVFPGLSATLAVLVLLDHLSCERDPRGFTRTVEYIVLGFSILIWVLSANASARRITGPDWQSQFDRLRVECKSSSFDTVSIKILPEDKFWKLDFSCHTLTES
jgi:hypothetical protein